MAVAAEDEPLAASEATYHEAEEGSTARAGGRSRRLLPLRDRLIDLLRKVYVGRFESRDEG